MDSRTIVRRYLQGQGIEIGALHQPLYTPKDVRVSYVDRMGVDYLRRHYPELNELPLIAVDVVDDGEELRTFESESQDFIIANHFLEHTQDPIRTIKRHTEILKPEGILYMAVPDKRWTFDVDRPSTSLEHLIEDHEKGPSISYRDHVVEYVALVEKKKGEDLDHRVEEIIKLDYSIHFHVWTTDELKLFLQQVLMRRYALPLHIEEVIENPAKGENICILRKRQFR